MFLWVEILKHWPLGPLGQAVGSKMGVVSPTWVPKPVCAGLLQDAFYAWCTLPIIVQMIAWSVAAFQSEGVQGRRQREIKAKFGF